MNHVFVSYSRNEEILVNSFVNSLREEGYSIWIDKSGAGLGIPFSTKWFDVIVEALYTAEGAIIFHSDAWDKSIPCKKEFDIIHKCDMPYIILETTIIKDSFEEELERARAFIKSIMESDRNYNRRVLMSNAHAYKAGVDPYQLIQYARGFFIWSRIKYLAKDLRKLKKIMIDGDYKQLNPDMYPYMCKYLNFARNTTIRQLSAIGAGFVVSIFMIVFIISCAIAIPQAMLTNSVINDGMAWSGEIDQDLKVDPVSAASKTINIPATSIQTTSFFTLNYNAKEIGRSCLPYKCILNASDNNLCSYNLDQDHLNSEYYSISAIDNIGSITVTDNNSGESVTINTPSTIDGYAWNDKGDRLIYWFESRVFVYDAAGRGNPIELDENFQKIVNASEIEIDGKYYIAARTESNTIVIWEDPILMKRINRDISSGVFLQDNDLPTAIFIHGNSIILNCNNNEHELPCSIDGTIDSGSITVSDDNQRIAVIYSKENEHIAVINLANTSIELDVEAPFPPTALEFDHNGKWLFATGRGRGLMRVDLSTGEVECSTDNYYMHNLALYGEKIVVTDYNGNAVLYNQNLEQDMILGAINNVQVPSLDVKIAEKYGLLVTANRGAGETAGCARFNLNTNDINLFVVKQDDGVAANTAVAISEDEEYVAFGYPNGKINIYESRNMYLADTLLGIGEYVAALDFSKDGSSLFVLGNSGTIYEIDIPQFIPNNNIVCMQNNWTDLQEKYRSMVYTYYEGIEE